MLFIVFKKSYCRILGYVILKLIKWAVSTVKLLGQLGLVS